MAPVSCRRLDVPRSNILGVNCGTFPCKNIADFVHERYDIGIISTIYVAPGFVKALNDPSSKEVGLITAIYYAGKNYEGMRCHVSLMAEVTETFRPRIVGEVRLFRRSSQQQIGTPLDRLLGSGGPMRRRCSASRCCQSGDDDYWQDHCRIRYQLGVHRRASLLERDCASKDQRRFCCCKSDVCLSYGS
jgi:hypothetical protein